MSSWPSDRGVQEKNPPSDEEMDFNNAAPDNKIEEEVEITDHIIQVFSLSNGIRNFLAQQGVDSLTGIQACLGAVAMQSAYVADVEGKGTEQSSDAVMGVYRELVKAAVVMIRKQKEEAAKAKEITKGKSLSGLAKGLK